MDSVKKGWVKQECDRQFGRVLSLKTVRAVEYASVGQIKNLTVEDPARGRMKLTNTRNRAEPSNSSKMC